MFALVCNCSRAVWKFIGHILGCDISDSRDRSVSTDSTDSRQDTLQQFVFRVAERLELWSFVSKKYYTARTKFLPFSKNRPSGPFQKMSVIIMIWKLWIYITSILSRNASGGVLEVKQISTLDGTTLFVCLFIFWKTSNSLQSCICRLSRHMKEGKNWREGGREK